MDLLKKRAKFININNNLHQKFYKCHPRLRLKVNLSYNWDFTGSPLWDLFSRETEMLENTWNTAVRIMFDLPRQTH